MGRPQRDKGKRGERELAAELEAVLGLACRRGQQYSGIAAADVVGVPGVHIECKRTNRLRLAEAIAQARADSPTGAVPVVCSRADGQRWLVTVELANLARLAAALLASEAEYLEELRDRVQAEVE